MANKNVITKIRTQLYRLLRWSEKYTKTDMVYLTRGGFWMTCIQATAACGSLITAIGFANLLPAETFGVYKYILSVSGLLSAFSLSGLHTSIIQSSARNFEGLFRKSFWINLAWSWPMSVVAIIIASYYFFQQNTTLAWAMIILAVASPVLGSSVFYKSYLSGKKAFATQAILSIFYNILPNASLIVFALFFKTPLALLAGFFVSNIVISIILNRYVTQTFKPNHEIDPKSLTYSKHLSFINILDICATYLDKILVFQLIGATELALYTFATTIPEQLRTVIKNVGNLALPKFAQQSTHNIKKRIVLKIVQLASLTTLGVGVYYFLAPYIYTYIFPQYSAAIPYSQLFALILIVEGGLPGAVFKAHLAVKESYILNISSNVIKILLMVTLTFMYGLWGIIIARIISRIFSFVVSLALLKRL